MIIEISFPPQKHMLSEHSAELLRSLETSAQATSMQTTTNEVTVKQEVTTTEESPAKELSSGQQSAIEVCEA